MVSDASGKRALAANVLLLGFLGAFAWLEASYPDLYYRSVQEDQALEWASFWSFFVAGGVFAVAAWRQHRRVGALPWFLVGLALFCVFVAMEEISWGQRVFGHRPPDYFLAENYQQELNLHNLASTKLRLLVFRGIILGYGVLLPLLALVPFARRLLDRFAIVPPPVALAPSMFAMFWIHASYPWKFTGEVIECALGFGFLFAAIANAERFSAGRAAGRRHWWQACSGSPWCSRCRLHGGLRTGKAVTPRTSTLARAEAEALKNDLIELAEARGKPAISKCGLHKRVYTFVETKKYARPLAGRVVHWVGRSRPPRSAS